MSKQPTHKQLVKAIKDLITDHGGFIYKHYSGGPIGMNGISDLIGCYKGKAIAFEVKTGKNKLTDAQAKFLKSWSEACRIAISAGHFRGMICNKNLSLPLYKSAGVTFLKSF